VAVSSFVDVTLNEDCKLRLIAVNLKFLPFINV